MENVRTEKYETEVNIQMQQVHGRREIIAGSPENYTIEKLSDGSEVLRGPDSGLVDTARAEEAAGIRRSFATSGTDPMDDAARALRLIEIRQRYLEVAAKTLPGRNIGKVVVDELKSVLQDYEELLAATTPTFPHYKISDIQSNMAEVLEKLARVYGLLGNEANSRDYFMHAARLFGDIGQVENAQRCLNAVTQAEDAKEGSLDYEKRRLQSILRTTPVNSLLHARALVELAEVYKRESDDYNAIRMFETAVSALEALGYPDPEKIDLKDAMNNTMQLIQSGKRTGNFPTPLESAVTVYNLYSRLYAGLIQSHNSEPEKAKFYEEKLKRMKQQRVRPEDLLKAVKTFWANFDGSRKSAAWRDL